MSRFPGIPVEQEQPQQQRSRFAGQPVEALDAERDAPPDYSGAFRATSGLEAVMSGLVRGEGALRRSVGTFDDYMVLRGEQAESRSYGDIFRSMYEGLKPGTEPTFGRDALDLVQRGMLSLDNVIGGDPAVRQARRDEARQAIGAAAVSEAADAARFPGSALSQDIGSIVQGGGGFVEGAQQVGRAIMDNGIVDALSYPAEVTAESLLPSAPGMAAAMLGGRFGGASGGTAGGFAGHGASAMIQGLGPGVIEYLAANGINTSNADAVVAALDDPEIAAAAADYALAKASASAPYEAVAGGIGGRMMVPSAAPGGYVGREAANAFVAQPVAQGVLGALGEQEGAQAVGEDINLAASMFQNIVGEAGMSAADALGIRSAAREREATDVAQGQRRPPPAAEAPPPRGSQPAATPPAPAAAMSGDADLDAAVEALQPRVPPAPDIPATATREQLVAAYEAAQTPDEQAAAAAAVAAFDQQEVQRVEGDSAQEAVRDVPEGARSGEAGRAEGAVGGGQAAAQDGRAGQQQQGATPRSAALDLALTRSLVANERRAARAEGRPAEDITPVSGTVEVVPDGGSNAGSEGLSRAIRDAFGVDITFFRATDPRWDGYNALTRVRGHENTIFINESSDSPFISAAAHELTHEIKTRNQSLYNRLDERLRAAGANVELFMEEFLGPIMLRNNETPFDAADPIAREELYAETGQALFKDKPFLEQLRRTDPGLLNDLINTAIQWIDTVLSKLRSGQRDIDISRYYNDLQAVRDAFAEYYSEAARENRRGGSSQGAGPVAQRSYHGSPTRGIERYSTDAIGTGEGNQSFGWGLYFSGGRDIADGYRRGLSAVGRKPGGTMADALMQKYGGRRGALEAIARLRSGSTEQANRMIGSEVQMHFTSRDGLKARLDEAEAFLRADNSRGQLYQQEIPEDHELLDWDAPLSDQPDSVRAALSTGGRGRGLVGAIGLEQGDVGSKIYQRLSINIGGDRQASEYLGSIGIPGLRYRSGQLSGISDSQISNYVIWDESRIGSPEGLVASRASFIRNLTPAEQNKVTDKVAEKVVAQLQTLPPAREMAAVAVAGRAKRGWYRQSAQTISDVFGPDAPLFAGLLAALSPQISVEGNLRNTLHVWRDWNAAGRPEGRDEILRVLRDSLRRNYGNTLQAWENNTVRALQGQGILSGPKVDSFMRNLLGDVEAVTNDAWMANYALVNQTIFKGALNVRGTDPGKGSGYLAMSARVREAARMLTRMTGETWTPAEVQETIWSWAKTLTEMADSATEIRSAEEIVLDRDVRDELIAATPDFATLFTQPEYRHILEEAGYGQQVEQVDSQRDAAGAAVQEQATGGEAGPFAADAQLRQERRAARRIDQLRARRREVAEEVEESSGDVPFSRRQPGRNDPLPGAPKVRGATGPDPRLVDVAERYARDNGIDLRRQSEYVSADPDRGRRIADAYEAMEHAPNDPRVRRAYADLIEQTTAQYRALEEAGYRFYFDTTGANPWDAMRQLRADQTMGVFPTDEGFGSGATEIDVSDNPLMADTGIRWPNGSLDGELRPVLANDLFRAVHDAFGHGLEGAGFRADGEENAWQAHVRLFTGDAVGAITTETRGQNSWLNFGPHGDSNRTARVEDTVFADQKTGLLPEWVWTEGRADDAPVASRGWSAKPVQPDAVSVDAYHYSSEADLEAVDPSMAGTVAAGGERRRFGMGNFGRRGGTYARANFYVREDGAPVPQAEGVVSAAGGRHAYRVQLDNLYDLREDPRGFAEEAGANQDLLEEEISDAGFDGFVAGRQPGIDTPVAVVFDIGDAVIPVEPVGDVAAFSRAQQTETTAFRRWFGDSVVVDENGEPLVVYHGASTVFDAFDASRAGENTGAANSAAGFFFTNDEGQADSYVGVRGRRVDAFIRIENPLHLTGLEYDSDASGALNDAIAEHAGKPQSQIDQDDAAEYVDYLKRRGFDGIEVEITDGTDAPLFNWIVFDPTQIKSATGNSGDFDPENPSIIASRRTRADAEKDRADTLRRIGAAYVPPPRAPVGFSQDRSSWVGMGRAFREARDRLQDRMIALRDVQEDIETVAGETLDDAYNAYRIENLMRDEAGDKMRQIERSYIEPLMDLLRKNKIPLRALEGYLLARATPEINAKIARVRADMQDGGSGLLTQQAKDILAGKAPEPYTGKVLTPAQLQVLAEAAKHVDGLRKWTLDTRQAQGLLSPEQRKALDAQQFYVPARGFLGEDDALSLTQQRGKGTLQSRSTGIRRAFGRGAGNLPADIVANMVDDAQHAAWDSSVAKMKVAIMRLALRHPNRDVWEVEPVDMEWRLDSAGQAYLGVKNSALDAKNSVMVPYRGKFYRVRINDPYLQRALLDSGSRDLNVILKVFAAINRWQASVFTRFNPLFPIVALARGAGFGATYVTSKHGAGVAGRAALGFPKAVRGLYLDDKAPGDSSVPDAQKTYADWAREARENGAAIQVAQMAGVKDTALDITRELQTVREIYADGGKAAAAKEAVKRAVRPLGGVIEEINNAFENAYRLAVYVELRKQGSSPQKAAETYKDMMTNFRRRGRLTEEFGALWLFFNPAMQGAHAFGKVVRDPKVLVALNALGALQALAAWSMMGIDDDDDGLSAWDDLEPWKKERSLVLPIGAITGDYRDNVFIPLEYGFNIFPYMYARTAQEVHDRLTGRHRPDTHYISDVARVVSKSFSPIPFDETGGVFGNVVSIYAKMKQNKDDLGRSITQGEQFAREGTPRSSLGTPASSPVSQGVANALNRIGGGDDYTAPYILPQVTDVSPQEIEYLFSQVTGGIGNAVTQISRMAQSADAGLLKEPMDVASAAPIVRQFVSRSNKRIAISNEFYDQSNYALRELDRFRDAFARGTYANIEDAQEAFAKLRDEGGPVLKGLELDTYADVAANKKLGRVGEIKTDGKGRPQIKRASGTVLGALEGYDYFIRSGGRNVKRRQKGAMAQVREINKSISALRARDLTYADVPAKYKPEDAKDSDRVSNRDRLRAIDDLQQRRMVIQQGWLKMVTRNRGDE